MTKDEQTEDFGKKYPGQDSIDSIVEAEAMIHSKLALVVLPLHAATSFKLMPGPRSLGNTHLEVSRRTVFEVTAQGVLSSALLPSIASAAPPTLDDLKKLQIGHSRVQYLLANWEKLTESCNNKAMSETESRQVVRTEGGGKVLDGIKQPVVNGVLTNL
ncbi:hypothetical protein THAOC_31633 [Thalassiosira oceanica]|uniref:Uncharacterized protein n=1 Tax=Thalassiosira oceanica TaxID=159749 RepID=K0RAY7_THAOC|nr:hypothetical protein THAOC_31633 [Thalassiosira oceanica]|eukprot:EJK49489.1 hypothetical protein THAOC_31633 [Thalassiosira oceanica]